MKNRVRELRDKCGWTQTMLADRLNVSRQPINAIETGRYDPSLPLAFAIAKLFKLSIEAIFTADEVGSRHGVGVPELPKLAVSAPQRINLFPAD